jgi:hypothetical protein
MNKTLLAAAAAFSLTACGGLFCIARGALVSTPRGKRRIEDLVVGDTVWCVVPESGERVEAPLVQVRSAKREIMRIEGEGFSLRCTTDHPLYDPVAKEWSAAGDWVLGKRSALLLVEEDARPRVVQVSTRVVADGLADVFDLSVDHALHNFVADDVLVHNKSPIRDPRSCTDENGATVQEASTCSRPDGGAGIVLCEAVGDAGSVVVKAVCSE